MKTILFALLIGAAPSQTEEAQALYREGLTLYDSADYEGAVERFTAALASLGDDEEPRTRQALLFNIGTAHEKQFAIDRDVTHLRQALVLYKQYRDFAKTHADLGEGLDVEVRVARIRQKLRAHDQIERARADQERPAGPPPPAPKRVDEPTWKKPRDVGLGLVVAGAAAAIGGTTLAVVGSRLEPQAQAQVDELAGLGVPEDHPSWAEGAEFVAQERRRGNAMLGTGVTLAVVGAVGVGVGSYYLVRAKKVRDGRLSATPTLTPGFAGVQVSGRF